MKKKMLFMAAIAGLISLGSCVKDDVSGSVEAVRNAKANQLNGLANEANANAALANANAAHVAAMQAADVAYKQAQAAEMQAQAQIRQAQAQHDAETLADKIAQTVAQYKAGEAQANVNALQAANDLLDLARQASTDERNYITGLINDYYQAYADYVNATQVALAAKAALESAKVSAENADEAKAVELQDVNETIAKLEALIEELGKVEASGMSDEEAWKQSSVKKAELAVAQSEFESSEAVTNFLAEASELGKKMSAFSSIELKIDALNNAIEDVLKSKGLQTVTGTSATLFAGANPNVTSASYTAAANAAAEAAATIAAAGTGGGNIPAAGTGNAYFFEIGSTTTTTGGVTTTTYDFTISEAPAWWVGNDRSYFTISGSESKGAAVFPYANYSTVRFGEVTTTTPAVTYALTHNDYDQMGIKVGTWIENVVIEPAVTTSAIGLDMSGNTWTTAALNFDSYRPNERVKYEVEKLIDPTTTKNAVGSESDTAKTKYKDVNGDEVGLTAYAKVKAAEAAKTANATKMTKVESDTKALSDLWIAKETAKNDFEDTFNSIGTIYYDDVNAIWKKLGTADNYTEDYTTATAAAPNPLPGKATGTTYNFVYDVVTYTQTTTTGSPTFGILTTGMLTKGEVYYPSSQKNATSPKSRPTLLGKYLTTRDAYLAGTATKKELNAVATESAEAYDILKTKVKAWLAAQEKYDDAVAKESYPDADVQKDGLGNITNVYTVEQSQKLDRGDGAKGALYKLKENIEPLTAAIQDAKENLAKAKEAAANADAFKTSIDDKVKAADSEAYAAAADELKAAADEYDLASLGLLGALRPIWDLQAEIAALETAATQDIDERIAQATKDLADAKTLKAQLENANTPELILAAAQANLDKAIENQEAAEAKLLIATQAIKDLDIDFSDLDGYNEEEPAEDPSEEPSEEPAGDEPAGDEPAGDEPAGDEPAGDE